MTQEISIEIAHKCGQGNWGAFAACGLDLSSIHIAADAWRSALRGVQKAWLCWHVDSEWSLVQQRLVASLGWTPVVGFDPRSGPPQMVLPQSIVVDFNATFQLPVMYPHFPLEFAFLFIEERIAFWHSDLLVRRPLATDLARTFLDLPDGATAATWVSPGWRELPFRRKKRYWELIGCTTRGASQHQFRSGAGWWMEFWNHPNCPSDADRTDRMSYYWDHGAGIYFWKKRCGGHIIAVDGKPIEEGHCTKINNPDFKRSWKEKTDAQRLMSIDIRQNFALVDVCKRLDLDDLLL